SFGSSTYGMQTHSDRGHYIICGLGTAESADNSWLVSDSGERLDICTLPKEDQRVPSEWDAYGNCALASSAFPVGLAPRQIPATFPAYLCRSFPIDRGGATLRPKFPGALSANFVSLNVDGGVINNNPFDYAQYALMGEQKGEKIPLSISHSA